MYLASHDQACLGHRNPYFHDERDSGFVTHYMGLMKQSKDPAVLPERKTSDPLAVGEEVYPVAFQVELKSGGFADAHFHQVDQFQLVQTCPGGRFGQMQVDEQPLLHFAAACSAYGPLAAGTQPLRFYTLRNGYDDGIKFVPQERPEAYRRPGRKAKSAHGRVPHRASTAVSKMLEVPVIPQENSGLFATYLQVPNGQPCAQFDPRMSRGQYWLVMGGSCEFNDKEAREGDVAFVAPEDAPLKVRAGPDGVSVLLMQFPRLQNPAP